MLPQHPITRRRRSTTTTTTEATVHCVDAARLHDFVFQSVVHRQISKSCNSLGTTTLFRVPRQADQCTHSTQRIEVVFAVVGHG
jgi:hypothetical protein